MIAALYVVSGGIYTGRPDVDAWDIVRDAKIRLDQGHHNRAERDATPPSFAELLIRMAESVLLPPSP